MLNAKSGRTATRAKSRAEQRAVRIEMSEPLLPISPDGSLRVLAPSPARERWSWALYDFANTIFSMNVVTLYFAVWIVTERGASNTAISVATSLSSVAVLLLAPWIGALSDASRRRKPWVVGLTLVCAGETLAFLTLSKAADPLQYHLIAFD